MVLVIPGGCRLRERTFGLHPQALEDCGCMFHQRAKVEEYGDHLLSWSGW